MRTRLLAGVLLLTVLALVGSGVVAAGTLRGYLLQRVDDQLRRAAGAIVHDLAEGRPFGAENDEHEHGRLPSEYVVEVLTPTGRPVGAQSNLVDEPEALPDFPHLTLPQVRQRGEEPFTVGSTTGDARWRVVAVPVPGGSGTVLVGTGLGEVTATVGRLETVEVGIGLVTLALVALAGGLLIRTALQPLREVEHTAAAIAGGDLSRRVADDDPRTEVGRLGATFNAMLGRIEESFRAQVASEEDARRSEERMRRFVADASHELRTPLTSIRGFAELHRLRRGASLAGAPAGAPAGGRGPAGGLAAPAAGPEGPDTDLDRSMARIESEATRMGLLVDDLLLLARLDRERPLGTDPVDLLAVAADVVHDASARAPGRGVRLIALPSDRPAVVVGDDARLRQVLTNLVDNALRHTPADSPVEVRVGTDAIDPTQPGEPGVAVAVLDVVDHGPGLPPGAQGRVFERFWRADPSRTRADGGAGLGLAIVSVLVGRHHGTVRVCDTPGGGATFRVQLPLVEA